MCSTGDLESVNFHAAILVAICLFMEMFIVFCPALADTWGGGRGMRGLGRGRECK